MKAIDSYVACRHLISLLAFVLLLTIHTPIHSDTLFSDTGFWSIQIENDVLASTKDRFYTHGAEITYATADTPPSFLEDLSNAIGIYQKGHKQIHGYSIGQKIFTPANITQPKLILHDRPYAGWLYVEAGIADMFQDNINSDIINGLILTLGIVGPSSYAEKFQKGLHDVINANEPKGWDNQLHDELGFNISYIRKWRQIFDPTKSKQFELGHHGGLTLGNVYTYISAGVMLRWGTHLKNDVGPPNISPGFPGIPAFTPSNTTNWYFFSGIEGRIIGRNIFLDGNTFRNSHNVDKKYFVADLQFGFAINFDNTRIALSNMLRTHEFDGQSDRTRFGAINITFYTSL